MSSSKKSYAGCTIDPQHTLESRLRNQPLIFALLFLMSEFNFRKSPAGATGKLFKDISKHVNGSVLIAKQNKPDFLTICFDFNLTLKFMKL